MEKFRIEDRDGDDYIVNLEHNFTLKVIPTGIRKGDDNAFKEVVYAIFATDPATQKPNRADFDSEDDFEIACVNRLLGMDTESFEFEGLNFPYWDDDVEGSNKNLWLETVNYYCQLKLGKTVVALWCREYD